MQSSTERTESIEILDYQGTSNVGRIYSFFSHNAPTFVEVFYHVHTCLSYFKFHPDCNFMEQFAGENSTCNGNRNSSLKKILLLRKKVLTCVV